jgi:hypothetical protein
VAWVKVGFVFMVFTGAFAFFVYATVLGHPEQDLPLWPAWVFTSLAFIGFALGVAAAVWLRPFRPRDGAEDRDESR